MAAKRHQYPLLNKQQLEEQLERFTLDWEQKLTNMGWSSDEIDSPIDEDWEEQHQHLRSWLESYMRPYQDRDRQRLTGTILNDLYAEFSQINEHQDPYALFEWVASWLIQAVTLYALFKPFLSAAQRLEYASPLRECYDIFQSQDPAIFDSEVYRMVNLLCRTYLKAD